MENIKNNLRVGLLPLYLKLYDDYMPEARKKMKDFLTTIEKEITSRKVSVLTAPISRVKKEFENAVELFEKADVDAIITLHLAYSPSLESLEALSKTELALIILDTTPGFEFGPETDPDELMFNHGIHGVQDLCSMLLRTGKYYLIESGHWEKSDVIDKVIENIKSAHLFKKMKKSVVGRVGGPFIGMGDFDVSSKILRETIGLKVLDVSPGDLLGLIPSAESDEINKEMDYDSRNFNIKGLSKDCHRNAIRMSLAFRRWIEKENLSAFTMNFSNIGKSSGFLTIPFTEASKAMSRGIGYAGEGDVLTAALVGTMLNLAEDTSFTEMFCPDWKNNRIFLSHMGEINSKSIVGKPTIVEKKLSFVEFDSFALIAGRFKPGRAFYLNLTPSKLKRFSLLISEVEVEDIHKDRFSESVRGWIRPKMDISRFLKEFSELGGTHHSVLVYDHGKDLKNILINFAKLMGWDVFEI